MRDFGFTVEYGEGTDPVMDVFIRYPQLFNDANSISVSGSGLWRVDSFTGPEAALEELEDVYTSNLVCNDCLGVHPECDAVWRYKVITREKGYRSVYSYLKQINYCHSIPYLSLSSLGDGLFFDAQRKGSRYDWRILMPPDRDVGELYDSIEEKLPEGISLTLEQLKEPERWGKPGPHTADLPHEQLETLATAAGMGYYETPRDATLGEIAGELDVPESTCRYRLRRAESWLTQKFMKANQALQNDRSK